MKVAVILVNYNGQKYNEDCICSVLESNLEGTIQIYVVDNGSTDDSVRDLRSKWGKDKRVTLLCLGENRGFSAANNAGMRRALEDEANYIMLLNNDTIIEKNMIGELINALHEDADCIAVPKIYYYNKKDVIWSAGGGFTRWIMKPFSYGDNQKDSEEYEKKRRCKNGNGCCLMMSRSVMEKIGYLKESFFLYYEDTEFFLRAGERDIAVLYVPRARMYHKVNGSTGGNDNPACVYYITRNWLSCHKMHLAKWRFLLFLLYFALNRIAWASFWLVKGKREQIRAIGRGIHDYIRGIGGKYSE